MSGNGRRGQFVGNQASQAALVNQLAQALATRDQATLLQQQWDFATDKIKEFDSENSFSTWVQRFERFRPKDGEKRAYTELSALLPPVMADDASREWAGALGNDKAKYDACIKRLLEVQWRPS